jgi:hypothetical protein
MRASVRELCAQETTTPTTAFVEDDPELDKRINEALCDLRDFMIEVEGQEWASTTYSFTTTGGVDNYALPDDFDELLGVRAERSSSQYALDPWEYADLAMLENATAYGNLPQQLRYRLKGEAGDEIVIKPTPTGSSTIYLDYIPSYIELTDPAHETFNMPFGHWKWAALSAAIDCLNKEDLDTAALERRLAAKEARIRRKASRRDAGRAPRIKDTRKDRERLRSRRYPALWSDT